MYGGLFFWEHSDTFENQYYNIAKEKPSPLSDAFDEAYFREILAPEKVRKLSLKAALATEQRIPGVGNGTLQDILFHAKMNPRRKLNTLNEDEKDVLFRNVKETLARMTQLGGRSTEKDLFGKPGGYQVVLSAKTKGKPCPFCNDEILKESYLGGSVYYCPTCQPK
jgi:formamidopyrimidine-DNA glycosylase